ncbi:hypothetical protein CBL_06630 [Carabus blaptoides fortunei]
MTSDEYHMYIRCNSTSELGSFDLHTYHKFIIQHFNWKLEILQNETLLREI